MRNSIANTDGWKLHISVHNIEYDKKTQPGFDIETILIFASLNDLPYSNDKRHTNIDPFLV